MYTLIDIKTTTANVNNARLLYIKIEKYNLNLEKVSDFESFINPEFGISNQTLQYNGVGLQTIQQAPKFFEVAKTVIEHIDGCILLGFKMSFIYQVIKNSFKELGFSLSCKNLSFRQLNTYFKWKLHYKQNPFEAFQFICSSNHRKHLERLQMDKTLYNQVRKPISQFKVVDDLPEEAGVYYFYNKSHKLIYIGKSINIKKRVQSHLSSQQTKKAMDMKSEIHQIKYTTTGSELIALLLESDEIKKHRPKFNRKQKRAKFQYGLYHSVDQKGYINFEVSVNRNSKAITTFGSQQEGMSYLEHQMKKHDLCQCLSSLYKNTSHTCFLHQIKDCKGAAIGAESKDVYNQKAKAFVHQLLYPHRDFLIIGEGRNAKERSIVHIKNFQYQGWAYCSYQQAHRGKIENVLAKINSYQNNKDIELIIQLYLKQHSPTLRVIDPDKNQ